VLDEYPEDGSADTREIDSAIGADRIWLVASHLGYLNSETEKIQAHIQNSGYRLQRREERPGAFIELWIRSVQEKAVSENRPKPIPLQYLLWNA
jgi:hypothetical protein